MNGRFLEVAPAAVYVDTFWDVQQCIHHCWDAEDALLGVDTETLGKGYLSMEDQVVVLGLCPDEASRYLVPRKNLHYFSKLLASEELIKCVHNWKFDAHRIANAGLVLGGPAADTLFFDFLYDEDTRQNRHRLELCSDDYFNIPMAKYKDLFGDIEPREMRPGHPLWRKYLDYSTLDPWVHRKLAVFLMEKLKNIKLWEGDDFSLLDHYWEVEEPQIKTLYRMERRGIRIDVEHLDNLTVEFQKTMDVNASLLCTKIGRPIKIGSTKQLKKLFLEELKLPVLRTTPGGDASMDVKVMQAYADGGVEEAKLIMGYRKAEKNKSTYTEGLKRWIYKDGNIHANFNPLAVTGRLTCKEPNLQNIPSRTKEGKRIRQAFIADNPESDILIVADYSQLEMRVLACFAQTYGDDTMMNALNEGLDMHSYTATMFLNKSGNDITYEEFLEKKRENDADILAYRTAFKDVGFGIVYGRGAPALAEALSSKLGRSFSVNEAQGYIEEYLNIFPGVRRYLYAMKDCAKKKGYVQTMAGRFRRLSAIRSNRVSLRRSAERMAINTPIQGSAADIVKKAMILCDNDKELTETLETTLRLQIHDELVFNCKGGKTDPERLSRAVARIRHIMEHPLKNDLPVVLTAEPETGENWAEAK